MIWIKSAKYVKDFKIDVHFNNGRTFRIDLEGHLKGQIFSPIRKVKAFTKFRVHPELETVVWGNGADFAPEFLYKLGLSQNRVAADGTRRARRSK